MVCLQFVKEMLLQSGPLVLQYQPRCSYKVKLALPGRAGEVTVSPISTSTHTRHPWKMRWASAARSFRFLEDLCTCNRNVMAALTVWTLRPTPTSCYHTAGLESRRFAAASHRAYSSPALRRCWDSCSYWPLFRGEEKEPEEPEEPLFNLKDLSLPELQIGSASVTFHPWHFYGFAEIQMTRSF